MDSTSVLVAQMVGFDDSEDASMQDLTPIIGSPDARSLSVHAGPVCRPMEFGKKVGKQALQTSF